MTISGRLWNRSEVLPRKGRMVVRPSTPSAPAGTDPARSFRSPCSALRPLLLPPCSFPPAPALSLRFGPLPRASASSLCSGVCSRTLLLPPHPNLPPRFGPFTSVLPASVLLHSSAPLFPAFLPSADPSRSCRFADPSLPGRSLLWPCHPPAFCPSSLRSAGQSVRTR